MSLNGPFAASVAGSGAREARSASRVVASSELARSVTLICRTHRGLTRGPEPGSEMPGSDRQRASQRAPASEERTGAWSQADVSA
jgi:hypothetical protein